MRDTITAPGEATATGTAPAAGLLADLAGCAPALHECVRRCLVALAAAPAGDGPSGSGHRRRYVRAALTPLRDHLRTVPADARTLIAWLFRHDHALLEDAAVWEHELPGLPMPGGAAAAAFLDAALGLPPVPDDDALLREWHQRQGDYGRQHVLGHPSPYPAIRALARRLELAPGEYLCDLGSGHGRVVLYLALLGRPACGVELLPDRHAAAHAARRRLRVAEARFVRGSVLDEHLWSGPDAVADAGWYYCYDPFDDATHAELLDRLRTVAGRRPVRLAAFVQTSRYRERYQQGLADGRLRLVWPPSTRLSFGLHLFQVEGGRGAGR